jgi:tetratricopeptide (TPR) repeat protein
MRIGQVFVSHTSEMDQFPEDRSFVQAALDAVSRVGMAPADMRYFAARDGKPADYCRQRVRECEIYVAVIGFRYGSIVPGESVSYTELEFDEASTAGLPRLVFLLGKPVGLPATLVDADRDAVEGFRQRLSSAGLVVRSFTSAAALELEVFHALTEVTGAGLPAVQGTAQSALALRYSLPPETPAFIGRNDELNRIIAEVAEAAGSGGVVAIHAIDGMPGVGKTALAVHVAHELSARFPDRQLFIDLHAHTPGREPVAPQDALAELLTAVGIDPRFVPADVDGRAAMWRDQMAGQPALLLLDNAASSAQVAPLLPGDGTCLVLVTSRRYLGDLPGAVTPVMLDVLPPKQAEEMFTRLAPRAVADRAGVAEVVRLAGFLPLAVSLLGRVFARHPSWTLADLAVETHDSLLTLKAEHHSIAAAFDVSYRHLEPRLRRFFDLLGLHPGTTTERYAAAAVAGISPGEAAGLLDALHGEGLVTETGHRRYGMHDLLRRYARDHAAADPDGERALGRLLDYYQDTAARADARITRQTRQAPRPSASAPAASPPLEDAEQALTWARADRDSLLGCLDHATSTGQHARIVALTAALAELMQRDGPWTEAITRHRAAFQSARHLGDQLGHATALHNLGTARQLTGDYQGAARDLEQALDIYRDLGNRLGQANALHNLGTVRRLTGDYHRATSDLEQALTISGDLGDPLGQANALANLGIVRRLTANYQGAARDLEQALGIYRDLGSRLGQADALINLGAVRRLTGDYASATADLQLALAISGELGDQRGQANALFYLGDVRRGTGDYPGATADLELALAISGELGDQRGQANALAWLGGVRRETGDYQAATADLEQALAIYDDLGDRLGRANTLLWLGVVRRGMGDYLGAAGHLERALAIYRDIGSRPGQANALNNLGSVRRETGDHQGAAGDLEQALAIFRELGNRDGQADVLNEIGALHRVSNEPAEAEACHQQALELAHGIGSAPNEAHALAGLGRCAATAGDATRAETLMRQAYEMFQRIGAAEAASVLAELDAFTRQDPPG